MDYAGPFLGHQFLVLIDAYSKWPIVKLVPNLSSKTLITVLRYIFADYGKPNVMVSDNGRSFVAADTVEFLRRNGVKFMHSPPWHPSSNGLGERTVQSFKKGMKKHVEGDVHTRLARTSWAMRTRPSPSSGKTPAELFMGREFRTHLSSLHPRDAVHPHTPVAATSPYAAGQAVWALKHVRNGTTWVPGRVSIITGSRTCDVTLEEGGAMRNIHVDHLRRRSPLPDSPVQAAAPRTEKLVIPHFRAPLPELDDGPNQLDNIVGNPEVVSPEPSGILVSNSQCEACGEELFWPPAPPHVCRADQDPPFSGFPDSTDQGAAVHDQVALPPDLLSRLSTWTPTVVPLAVGQVPDQQASPRAGFKGRGRGSYKAIQEPGINQYRSRAGRVVKPQSRYGFSPP